MNQINFKKEEWFIKSKRNIASVFNETANNYPDNQALVFQEERLNYREFKKKVDTLTRSLIRLGIKKGDHVAIWMTNNLEWIYTQFACLKLGAVIVPVNTRYKASEVEYILQQSDATTLVFEEIFLGKFNALEILTRIISELDHCLPGNLNSQKYPYLKNIICKDSKPKQGIYSFTEIMELGGKDIDEDELNKIQAGISPDDIGYIMYTSGTTGFPKGAMLPQRNTLACFYQLTKELDVTQESKVLCAAPLFTNFGSTGSVLSSVLRGACTSIIETFDAEIALKTMDKEKVTHVSATPSMIIMMLEHPDFKNFDISSWKTLCVGGAIVTESLISDLKNKTSLDVIINGYGLVEGAGLTSTTFGLEPAEQTTTLGKPLPYCRVKIVNSNTGEEMPVGENGEICSQGTTIPGCHIMKGYYKKPKETAEAIKGGWLYSGDMGRLTENGYIELTGRVKDMILVGGFNVYPAETEGLIQAHPNVKLASVIGIPDHRLGEVPMAFVELKKDGVTTEDEIINFCKDKISNIKVPRHVSFIHEFPMTSTGKIQKFKLKEIAQKSLSKGKNYKPPRCS